MTKNRTRKKGQHRGGSGSSSRWTTRDLKTELSKRMLDAHEYTGVSSLDAITVKLDYLLLLADSLGGQEHAHAIPRYESL